jgi:hypothetical protein
MVKQVMCYHCRPIRFLIYNKVRFEHLYPVKLGSVNELNRKIVKTSLAVL